MVVTPKSEKDELGHAFAQMVASLRTSVGQVAESAASLGSASAQLSSAANQAGAGHQPDRHHHPAGGAGHLPADRIGHAHRLVGGPDEPGHRRGGQGRPGPGAGGQPGGRGHQSRSPLPSSKSPATPKPGAIGSGKAAEVAEGGAQTVTATIKGMQIDPNQGEPVGAKSAGDGTSLRADRGDRGDHRRYRQPDQPAGAERRHRSGAGGRARQGFCGGGR